MIRVGQGTGEERYVIYFLRVWFVALAKLMQLPGKRGRSLSKVQHQRAKKGRTVGKCVSILLVSITLKFNLCSGKDEQAASSNPGGGGGNSIKEAAPTDTPPAGESNSVSKTAESSSDNAEPMEH